MTMADSARVINRLADFSCSDSRQLTRLVEIAHDVARRDIGGDIVECGVMNGGSAAALALGLPHRHLWLYDSFDGLPAPTARDGSHAASWVGRCRGSEDRVRDALALVSAESYTIRKGWFTDTFGHARGPDRVAVLHVDADWYDSVRDSLTRFYEHVSEGGAVVLDDFGYWEGCREALHDFCRARDLKPVFERFGHSAIWWIKGRTHNRDSVGRWDMP